MSRSPRLRTPPPRVGDGAAEMNRRDRFVEILDALAGDVQSDDLPPEELDRLYSEALAEGLISEEGIRSSFEALLDRQVIADPHTGSLSLVPLDLPSVGTLVRAYRERRGLTVGQLAREYRVSAQQIDRLESCADVYDANRLTEITKAVAAKADVALARVHTLIQAARATLEISSADGPILMAARKAPSE